MQVPHAYELSTHILHAYYTPCTTSVCQAVGHPIYIGIGQRTWLRPSHSAAYDTPAGHPTRAWGTAPAPRITRLQTWVRQLCLLADQHCCSPAAPCLRAGQTQFKLSTLCSTYVCSSTTRLQAIGALGCSPPQTGGWGKWIVSISHSLSVNWHLARHPYYYRPHSALLPTSPSMPWSYFCQVVAQLRGTLKHIRLAMASTACQLFVVTPVQSPHQVPPG